MNRIIPRESRAPRLHICSAALRLLGYDFLHMDNIVRFDSTKNTQMISSSTGLLIFVMMNLYVISNNFAVIPIESLATT